MRRTDGGEGMGHGGSTLALHHLFAEWFLQDIETACNTETLSSLPHPVPTLLRFQKCFQQGVPNVQTRAVQSNCFQAVTIFSSTESPCDYCCVSV